MKRVLHMPKGVFALLLALSLGMGTAYAYDFSAVCSTGQTLYYNITDATNHYVEMVFPGTGTIDPWPYNIPKPTGNINLPSTVTNGGVSYTVKRIGQYALACPGLSGSLTIPSSVTSIGYGAFWGSGFTGSLTIPNSVTLIEECAFENCTGFTGSLIIPNSLTTIAEETFYNCSGLTGSLTIPSSVTSIGSGAFWGCSGFTGSLTIPNSVTTLGSWAFSDCTGFSGTLTIGTGLTTIGWDTFQGCTGFTQVKYNAVNCVYAYNDTYGYDSPFADCGGTLTIGSTVQEIHEYMFNNCTGFTGSLNIPNSVTSIGSWAFYGCYQLTGSLTIPNSVTTIGSFAFRNCHFTGSLTIPNSVTEIGQNAFEACSGFTGSLTLSSSLASIEVGTFADCGFTGSLIIPNSVTYIGTDAFSGCTGFTGSLIIPNSVTYIDDAFQDCTGFTGSLTIPNSVTTLGSWAFSGCTGFSGTLTIGTGLTTIGWYTFQGCTGFTQVKYNAVNCVYAYNNTFGYDSPFVDCGGTLTIGSTVQEIHEYMFNNCSGFTGSLTIPNSVTTIGSSAFQGCTGFTGSLTIGNNVTSIGSFAFYGCTHFTGSLTIPNSVTEIGNNAFSNCMNFNGSLTIGNSVTSINGGAFYHCWGFTGPLTIPNSVTSIGGTAFDSCHGFSSLTLGNSLTSIGACAFEYCTGFTGSLTIPNSVTDLGQYAFYGCSGFNGMLTLPSSLTTINNKTFYGCSGLTSMTVQSETPPTLGTEVFYNVTTTLPVYVPCASLEDYQAASGWSEFTNYQCIPEPTLTVYDGTATNNQIPAYIYYFDDFTRSQFVIPAADLVEMTNNSITGMTFYTTNSASYTVASDADVYLMEVNYTQISAFEPKESATIVFSGRFSIESSEEGGEMTILFDTPYTYQGGNLLVGVENTQDNGWLNINFYGQTVNGASVSGFHASSTSAIPAQQQNFIPKTTFSYVPVSCEAITSYPWSTNFDNYAGVTTGITNNLPVCWNFINTTTNSNYSGYPSIFNQSTYAHSGNNYLRFYSYYYIDPQDQYAILPEMEGLNGKQIKLYARGYNAGNAFKIGMMTDPNDVSTFVEIATQTLTTSYQEYEYTLGEGNHVAIMMEAAVSGNVGVFIDDISIEEIPVCLAPTNLEAGDITGHTATLSWSGDQTSYNVRYKVAGGFFDDFENGLDGWTVIRNGGGTIDTDWQAFNARNWGGGSNHSGDKVASSFSWRNQVAYNVDNWLITPQVFLNGTLRFWVRCAENVYPDHYDVYVSTSSTIDINKFTLLHEPGAPTETWTEITVDLSAFDGAQGYIAIRHQDYDKECLWIDDFGIYTGSDWVELNGVTNPVTIEGLALSTAYEWQVQGIDCDDQGSLTDWSESAAFTTTNCETVLVDIDHPFTEGFEGTDFAPNCWESIPLNNQSYWRRNTTTCHDGSSGSAYSQYYGPIYLVLPDIELSSGAVTAQLTFWSYNTYPSDFTIGNNNVVLLQGDTETVLWSAETVSQDWVETTVDLTPFMGQTISLAFKYAGNNGNGWYVDDVEVALTNTYIFLADGDWNDGSHWNIGTVPPAGSDVIIQADAFVPAGYTAVANAVSLNGGSITVADGGQLKHNTLDLVVTMKKNIIPYTNANGLGNYYLLAFPFLSAQVPTAMTSASGSDFYRFDPSESGAEWRNHKQEPITFVQRRFGYLYANPEPVELSLTGTTLSVSNEFTMTYTVDYTEGSDSPYNGWELLGNPFTYNAYVYRLTSDNEIVPIPIMMYDEEGELQTVYGGPVAPMQGFFVHVTETTTVYFGDTGHDYVDLGLPSGTKWATCNVGANSPEEYGDHFAWGETTPKETYNWATYQYCNGSYNTLTKYCTNASNGYNGFTDDLTTLLPEDDAATANWGNGWRMPTKEEWQELYNNTTITWTTQNGVNGRLFTASNGNSLFLPAAGFRSDSLYGTGSYGNYWSSSLDTDYPSDAWFFYFESGCYFVEVYDRYIGRSVRPVREN